MAGGFDSGFDSGFDIGAEAEAPGRFVVNVAARVSVVIVQERQTATVPARQVIHVVSIR